VKNFLVFGYGSIAKKHIKILKKKLLKSKFFIIKKNEIIKKCIEESLLNNYFLHFPGNWYEGQMWKIKDIFNKKILLITSEQFYKYSKIKLKAEPKGRVLPK
jgi:hypothetical protein